MIVSLPDNQYLGLVGSGNTIDKRVEFFKYRLDYGSSNPHLQGARHQTQQIHRPVKTPNKKLSLMCILVATHYGTMHSQPWACGDWGSSLHIKAVVSLQIMQVQ